MNPKETVALTRYVRAMCPQQKFDEYTADAWHDLLSEYGLDEARAAAVVVGKRQPFVSPAEIIAVIRQWRTDNARDIQGPGLPAAVPDADPDDVQAYLAALRQQRMRAGDGLELKPRPMAALLRGVGQKVPDKDTPAVGPLGVGCSHCGAKPLHACRSGGDRRLSLFHPSRIDAARGGVARVSADEEIARRKAAAAAALAELPPGTVIEPQDDFVKPQRGVSS
jgi:hypothetical protein